MKKSIIYGTLLSLCIFIFGFITREFTLSSYISGIIGIGCLLVSGLLAGVFVSGHQNRANFLTENKDERKKRNKGVYLFALFGIPNFIVALLLTILN